MDLPEGIPTQSILLLLSFLHITSGQVTDSIVPVAVAGTVAGVLCIALFSVCGIILYRKFARTDKKKRKPEIIAIATEVDTDVTTLRSSNQHSRAYSNGGSNIETSQRVQKGDYWTRPERRGRETEEKVRRMRIADNFDEDAPAHSPPPPVLRAGVFESNDKSTTDRKHSDSSSWTNNKRGSSQYANIVYHQSEGGLDQPIDRPSTSTDLGHTPAEPSTSRYENVEVEDARPPFTRVIQSEDSGDDDANNGSNINGSDKNGYSDDEEDILRNYDGISRPTSEPQTPNPNNFSTPDDDGFYRYQVE